jgi:LPXTG-site transpeptidase (sortase) family protein
MTKQKKNKIKKSHSILIGSLIVLFGITCVFIEWYFDFKIEKQEEKQIESFFDEEVVPIVTPTEEVIETKKETATYVEEYIAILEIPKISFKRGLVDINSKRNNVKYNVQIIKPSDMPNITNGNLILASHSGSGYTAFFKNLYKLKKDDLSYVYYDNEKYTYQVVKIYEEDKDGTIQIKRNQQKTTLTMITCSQTNKTKQIVIMSELINKENY